MNATDKHYVTVQQSFTSKFDDFFPNDKQTNQMVDNFQGFVDNFCREKFDFNFKWVYFHSLRRS